MQRITSEALGCSRRAESLFRVQRVTLGRRLTSSSTTQMHPLSDTTAAHDIPPHASSSSSSQPQKVTKKAKRQPITWPQRPNQDPAEMTAHHQKIAIEYPYFIPRNSNGCVPVYSDFRNNRTRELTLIRNVEGDIQALKNDLVATLFLDTPSKRFWNHKLKNGITIHHNRHIVIQGGRWVNHVHKWLLARGF